MSKAYKVKPSKKQLSIMKKYWQIMQDVQDKFYGEIQTLEKQMEKETGITGIEFFKSPDDGCFCGIGNGSRTMKLIQQGEHGLG